MREISADNIAKETTVVAIPSQADIFRDIGERLRVGIGRTGKQEATLLEATIWGSPTSSDR